MNEYTYDPLQLYRLANQLSHTHKCTHCNTVQWAMDEIDPRCCLEPDIRPIAKEPLPKSHWIVSRLEESSWELLGESIQAYLNSLPKSGNLIVQGTGIITQLKKRYIHIEPTLLGIYEVLGNWRDAKIELHQSNNYLCFSIRPVGEPAVSISVYPEHLLHD